MNTPAPPGPPEFEPEFESDAESDPAPEAPLQAAAAPAAPRSSLIDFPCAFPIKVMGNNVPGFDAAMVAIALQFDAAFDPSRVERRPSKAGHYLGLTLTVQATSQAQLDELYRTLCTHPMVKVVL